MPSLTDALNSRPKPIVNGFQADLIDKVLHSDIRCHLLPGGRYSGKTDGAILALMLHGQKYARPRLLLGGTALDDIRANCEEAIIRWSERLGLAYHWPNKSTSFHVGSQIWEVRGLKDKVGQSRVRGRNYAGAFIDELSDCDSENWAMVYTSVRGPGVKLIAAWNPKGPRHWVEQLLKKADQFDAHVYHSTMQDNLYADEASVEAFQQRGAMAEFEYRRLIEGLPSTPEGQVYPNWQEPTAEQLDKVKGLPCWVGCDYGESSVTAAIYAQRLPDMSAWIITREYYYEGGKEGHVNIDKHAANIIARAPGPIARCWVDPSAVALRDALKKQRVPAYAAWNDFLGYGITDSLLQKGQLLIDAVKCPALTIELEDLVWNKTGEKPEPTLADHATDSMRYMAVNLRQGASHQRANWGRN